MRKLVDLTGKRFGKWTVIERAKNRGSQTYWKCMCDCGQIKDICGRALTNGSSKSCGCAKREFISKSFMQKSEDLTGKRFGKLTVISKAENIGDSVSWNCICDCGKTKVIRGYSLKNGDTKSCGCLHNEIVKQKLNIHGSSNNRLYRIWRCMKNRCERQNDVGYKLYGGRGISVCKEWSESFILFSNWAILNGYQNDLTIDRINVNGNYEPSNCRWITIKEQQNNKRNNLYITYNGKTHTATEWASLIGINEYTLIWRKKHGWSDKDCIEKPIRRKINSPNE